MKILIAISILLMLALTGFSAAAQSNAEATVFTCIVPAARHFTNLERIPLEVHLKSKDLDVDRAALNPTSSPKPQSNDAYLEIYAEQLVGKERKRVPLNFVATAVGRDLDESYVHYMVEIPIDETEKKAKISKHLDDLVREAKARKSSDPKLRLYEEKNSRQALMNTFDHIYTQNREGTFEFTCRYTPNSTKHPGTLHARPVQVKVDFKSDFLDQPNFH